MTHSNGGRWNGFLGWLGLAKARAAPETAHPDSFVVPDATRCVQCGVCGYNCPVGIPVRDYARQGHIVDDPACVQCGQCIEACPRGTLRWGGLGPPQPWPSLLIDLPLAGDYAEQPARNHNGTHTGAGP
jgi:ferredoxin